MHVCTHAPLYVKIHAGMYVWSCMYACMSRARKMQAHVNRQCTHAMAQIRMHVFDLRVWTQIESHVHELKHRATCRNSSIRLRARAHAMLRSRMFPVFRWPGSISQLVRMMYVLTFMCICMNMCMCINTHSFLRIPTIWPICESRCTLPCTDWLRNQHDTSTDVSTRVRWLVYQHKHIYCCMKYTHKHA